MVESAIPVDLLNPGQVFACLGFLEAVDCLQGNAEGGFDWSDPGNIRFVLSSNGNQNPFGQVLRMIAESEVRRHAPKCYQDEPKAMSDGPIDIADWCPCRKPVASILPVSIHSGGISFSLGHWGDGSSRNNFKLFAGQQRGADIACSLRQNVADLLHKDERSLNERPFDFLTPLSGKNFKLDARKAWTALDAGYSPDTNNHTVGASPVVELLAAVGLEHARPDWFDRLKVRYGVWQGLAPPILARAALAGHDVGLPSRFFRFTLAESGKNKNVTHAFEEI